MIKYQTDRKPALAAQERLTDGPGFQPASQTGSSMVDLPYTCLAHISQLHQVHLTHISSYPVHHLHFPINRSVASVSTALAEVFLSLVDEGAELT